MAEQKTNKAKKETKFLEKLQKLPLSKRKALFWLVVIIIGVFLFFVFFFVTLHRLANLQLTPRSERSVPKVEFKMMEMPEFDFDIDWEEMESEPESEQEEQEEQEEE